MLNLYLCVIHIKCRFSSQWYVTKMPHKYAVQCLYLIVFLYVVIYSFVASCHYFYMCTVIWQFLQFYA